MKHYFLTLLISLCIGKLNAQQTDSIPFEGGYLYYHVYGKGKPVVILTGGPGISCQQQEDVALKVGQNHQAILVEQRGTGRSMPKVLNKENINMEVAANDIKFILDQLKIKEATIYGHSYGSLLAVYFGAKYPARVNQLILAGPAPFNYLGTQMATYADNKEVRFGMMDMQLLMELDQKAGKGSMKKEDSTMFRKLNNATILYDKTNMDKVVAKIAKGKISTKTMILMSNSFGKMDLTESIKKFKKPISIICGQQDPLAFMAYEYQLLKPTVKVHWIAKAGHFAMFENEGPFYEALFEILK